MALYSCFNTSRGKLSPSLSSERFSMNSEHDIFLPIFWPCKSVLSNMIAQVSVCTASRNWKKSRINNLYGNLIACCINLRYCTNKPWELKDPGLQSRYLLEKWTSTRSRSWVSPVNENWARNFLRATSSVSRSKLKYLRYSSATALLKSLLQQKRAKSLCRNRFETDDKW